jgi:hypothetical protein
MWQVKSGNFCLKKVLQKQQFRQNNKCQKIIINLQPTTGRGRTGIVRNGAGAAIN